MTRLTDLRCDGVRRTGSMPGLPCRYLLCRVAPDIIGVVETKCPRCNTVRMWQFTGMLVGRGVST